jgi:AcrR family transcriptional regulator
MNSPQEQRDGPRVPRQERSRQKVELILEATMRLLDSQGIETLSTNAVAARAGVSIGTLYQFFANKQAILDALADRETARMAERVMEAMADPAIAATEARIAAVVRAVAASYGGRHGAHRLVLEHGVRRGTGRLRPLMETLVGYLVRERSVGPVTRPLEPAEAFVLIHAFSGVMRAMILAGDAAPTEAEVAAALGRLVRGYLE